MRPPITTGTRLSRRGFVAGAGAVLGLLALVAALRPRALALTPACDDGGGEPTPSQTEGPYFSPDSPERNDFRGDAGYGTPMVLAGTVLSTGCRPVAGALLDVWQADAAGLYDNQGHRLRGHFFTDGAGRFRLSTIVPGLYPGRTRHFHVKVQAPHGPLLTTQLYFPDEPANAVDTIHRPELEMDVRRGDVVEGTFTFVVRT